MAAVTGTILALGGIGASAAQAIMAQKQMNSAQKAAAQAANSMRAINEANAFNQLQVPTQAFDYASALAAQNNIQSLNALQGVGAEGVIGGVGQLARSANEQGVQIASALADKKFEADVMKAQSQQGINERKAERDWKTGYLTASGAQLARADAMTARNNAIEGMFGFAGQGLTSASSLLDLYKKQKDNTLSPGAPTDQQYGIES